MASRPSKNELGGVEFDLNSGGDHVETREGFGSDLGGVGSVADNSSGDLKKEVDAVVAGSGERSCDVSMVATREVVEVETVEMGDDTQLVEDDDIGGEDDGDDVGGQDEGSGSGREELEGGDSHGGGDIAVVKADTVEKGSDMQGLTGGTQDKDDLYIGDGGEAVGEVANSEKCSEGVVDMVVQVVDTQQVDSDAMGEAEIDAGAMHGGTELIDEDTDENVVESEGFKLDRDEFGSQEVESIHKSNSVGETSFFQDAGEKDDKDEYSDGEQMLQEEEKPQRKRGRPPKKRAVEMDEDRNGKQMIQAEEKPRRKRGRPPRKHGVEKDEDRDVEQMMQTVKRSQRKRGRPPKKHVMEEDEEDEERDGEQMMQAVERSQRKRGRPPIKHVMEEDEEDEERDGEQMMQAVERSQRKRGRPPIKHVMEEDEEDEERDGEHMMQVEETPRRKRGRPPGKHSNIGQGPSSIQDGPHARYDLPTQEGKTGFSVSDLVWGKVRSHPWWPGQIYDTSDASEMALDHEKKDSLLVAYFGDRTFAWCEDSQLKPFQLYFSQMEKQSNMDAFQDAVTDILDEVSRRLELGMTCSCIPEEAYSDIKHQEVENAGIQEGTNCCPVDSVQIAGSFQPEKLIEYVKELAQLPGAGADRLELLTAKAQLKAFYCSKGYRELPEFLVGGGLDAELSLIGAKPSETDTKDHSTLTLSDMVSSKGKPRGRGRPPKKHISIMEDSKKKKSLAELMDDTTLSQVDDDSKTGISGKVAAKSASPSSSMDRKRNAGSADSSGSRRGKRKKLDSLGDVVTESSSSSLKKSFKVGDRIRRVASQLTGSPPILKCNGETFQSVSKRNQRKGGSGDADSSDHTPGGAGRKKRGSPKNYSAPNEMFSQLLLAARDPMKGYSFLSMIVSFFTEFRDSVLVISSEDKKNLEKAAGKRGEKKSAKTESASSEISTPDYMQDSYWSDMIFQKNAGDELLSNARKRKGGSQLQGKKNNKKSAGDSLSVSLTSDPESGDALDLQVGSIGTSMEHDRERDRPAGTPGKKIDGECSPTALILNFNESNALPSETDLIRIFSGYGPLKEADTEVLKKSKRAKVVFKKRVDAEVAFSSAGKFSLFGPALVSYRLRFLPPPSRTSPNTMPEDKKDLPVERVNSEVPAQDEAVRVLDNTRVVSDVAQVEAAGASDDVQVVSVGDQEEAARVSDNAQEAPAQKEAPVASDTMQIDALDKHTAADVDQISDPALAEAVDQQQEGVVTSDATLAEAVDI